jgi:DNA invertase Pin-like site-specific DNA recombinase
MIAVWSVDRLRRSLKDLVGSLMELQAKHIDLYLHQQALDASTPMGKAMLHLRGAFADRERSIIQKQVLEQRIRDLAAMCVGKRKIAHSRHSRQRRSARADANSAT